MRDNKAAYWSLICYPLGLVLAIGALPAAAFGHVWSAAGLAVLGLYMLLFQCVWAHFASATTRPSVGDIVMVVAILSGAAFAVALVWCGFGTLSEVGANRLALASMLLPLIGQPLANACEHFFPRPKIEAEEPADKAA